VIIRYESKSCRICYQIIDHGLKDFLQKSQKSLDFGIVPTIHQTDEYKHIRENNRKLIKHAR